MRTVLIIDDNAGVREALALALSLRDIRPLAARDPAEGLALLEREPVDLVIQDMNFSADTTSGEEGVALFRAIRARHVDVPVVLLTAWTRLENAVELVKAGAADYLAKPWDDARLLATVENLLELAETGAELRRARKERRARKAALAARYALGDLVFEADATLRSLELACQVARSDVPVLVTGPNGSGKERIAEIIQANSSVKDGPFVTLNCGAIPADLVEAELFGAEAGAYTGAGKARAGKFEAADGGTLFLDEIGNLPPAGQVKLLRVLETGRFQRLGSNEERQVRVRIVSATNADLSAMIRAGTFRQDLYYRLNVIELELPPLARRPDDIVPLAEHFVGAQKKLDASAVRALQWHAWPGNVRELKNVMQRASLLSRGPSITAADLGLPSAQASEPEATVDKQAIEQALARSNGVVAQAAAELGLSRQALYRRMERLGISRPS